MIQTTICQCTVLIPACMDFSKVAFPMNRRNKRLREADFFVICNIVIVLNVGRIRIKTVFMELFHAFFNQGRFWCVDVITWFLHDIVSSAFILDLVRSCKVRVVLVLTRIIETVALLDMDYFVLLYILAHKMRMLNCFVMDSVSPFKIIAQINEIKHF